MKKIKDYFLIIMYVIFSLFFLLIWIRVEQRQLYNATSLDWLKRIVIIFILIGIYIGIYALIKRYKVLFLKYKNVILWTVLVCFFIVQLMIGNVLRVHPLYDYESVYVGAVDWVVTGDFSNYKEYFYYYPNNLGELFFLKCLFYFVSRFGIHDFYFIGMLVNSMSCVGAIAFSFYLIDMMAGYEKAFMALVLFLLTPPMWFTASVFYTDSLTMVFPIAMLFFYYYSNGTKEKRRRVLSVVAMILAGIIGFFLKPTVLIVLIAVFIDLILKRKIKELIFGCAFFISIFLISKTAFHNIFYPQYLNEETAYAMNTPYETWVYMGLNNDFGFSGDDTLFSRSIDDPVVRKQIMRQAIFERINERGIIGTFCHEFEKLVTAYSDGTFELSYTFQFGLVNDTNLERYLTLQGEDYNKYWTLCAYLYYELQFLLVICVFTTFYNAIKSKKYEIMQERFILILSLFGLNLFLMLWEVHYRYTVNYYPVLLVIAVLGLSNIFSIWSGFYRRCKQSILKTGKRTDR